ncbi:MAG TPA: TonB-dependent receptor [Puia sp.]|nr:TonB-dependent receptor [Puia sp.]
MKQTNLSRTTYLKNYLLLISAILSGVLATAQSLSGHLTDSATHMPIEGASVYIPALKLGAVSNKQGFYNLGILPRGNYDVQVQALGYATVLRQVNITGKVVLNFVPAVSYSPLGQVVVTSLGNITNTQRSPVPVTVVSHAAIREGAANTAIDLIASQPGVSETTEGVGTTKPQINGLGFDRVLVLTDGLPQEDFQWGDDHGILIDPYAVYDAEVIRGPASLQYGASAEAGVVNFKTAPFVPSGTMQGSWLSEYHANNGYIGNSLHIGGNNNGFIFDLRASGEVAHSYWNPKDGYVWGSAWNQGNARLTLGINKPWGYSRLSLNALYRRIQVPDGNRDSSGHFVFDNPVGEKLAPTLSNFLSYNATIASDKILDEYQAWWQNSIRAGKGNVGFDIGFTASVHHDIDSGALGENNMVVFDIPYALTYQLNNPEKGLKLTTGINGIYENERNLAPPPAPYVPDYEIPNYRNFEAGAFAIVEKNINALTVSGGLRYDLTNFVGNGMSLDASGNVVPDGTAGSSVQFTPFNNTYSGWSGSIGASYQLPHNQYVKLNVAKSFRAPAINELTSNGQNIGSNAFQLGNINLKAEEGYQVDLAYGFHAKAVSLELDGFYNHISNFIFADRTDSISQGYPVYEFVSSNTAILTGLTASFDVHPAAAKWLQWNNRFSYIYTWLPHSTDSTDHIPWIPAPHLHSELKFLLADKPGSVLSRTYVKVGLAHYWQQNDIYSALYTEVPAAAYTLVDAGLGTQFISRRTGRVVCSLFINATNLTNVAYADHLNLAQYFYAVNGNLVTVTNQRQGVFNMGRDFTFKVVFPFGSGSKSAL